MLLEIHIKFKYNFILAFTVLQKHNITNTLTNESAYMFF